MMQRFRAFVHEHELKDMYMHGRTYTWSSERERATLTRIDWVLVSVDWDWQHFDSVLQGLSSSVSDHTSLHLALNVAFRPKRRFKFESFWLKLEGFDEAVKEAWVCDPDIVDPFRRLDALFRNTAEYLQSWGQKRVGNVKLNIAIANTLILRLDVAQERRTLTPMEICLRRMLKKSVLGLTSLERTMARQRSSIRWLREGDANTALFHAVANGRRVKNHIASEKIGEELVMDQERKVEAFTAAYSQLLGRVMPRVHSINLEELEIPTADLQDLEGMFTEEEIWGVVKNLHPDRAPGPDGFIGGFYQRAWPVIKRDILAGLFKLNVGDGRGFARLNRALITLIPKKPEATEVKDYRPISLVHSFAKLFSKIMANRLRKRLGDVDVMPKGVREGFSARLASEQLESSENGTLDSPYMSYTGPDSNMQLVPRRAQGGPVLEEVVPGRDREDTLSESALQQERLALCRIKMFCSSILKKLAPPLLHEVESSSRLCANAQPFTPRRLTRSGAVAVQERGRKASKASAAETVLLKALGICPEELSVDEEHLDVYARFFSCRQCWASKSRGL
ncbi:hypothetical protein QYE76_027964 [Lolium multiflorum]|uniref:Reverse transcriptase n=1 Tax=Lolium multiflorum TaxID=4521 RepID=A0AAD8QK28_LOLMU|nr:hypothetical protein QYE76_027964 [Lolium multiflorum]